MARNSLKNIAKMIDIAKEELPIEEAFLENLKRSIELQDSANKRPPSQYYKPSSMNCIRNMYYTRTGAEQDNELPTFTNIGICNSGTDIHLRIQNAVAYMKECGFDCEYVDVAQYVKVHKLKDIQVVSHQGMETKLLNTKYGISFLCDGIIKYKRHYYILELKTESSFKFMRRDGVNPQHYNQVTCYSLSLGLPEVIFVYINRDNLDMKSYKFVPTDEMKQDIIGMIENCESYVKNGAVPPKPSISAKTCEYCPHKNKCRKEG